MTIWNERYSAEAYAFGKEPNQYFKSVIDRLTPGRLLVPGAGEGRDAVYAAKLGWEVHAFDLSHIGQQKALRFAEEEGVSIAFEVLDVAHFGLTEERFDLIALTFLHLPAGLRRQFFGNLHHALVPGGKVVLEAFNPKQLGYNSGGPKDITMLLTPDILKEELTGIDPLECYEFHISLDEGEFHRGDAEVVRYLGQARA